MKIEMSWKLFNKIYDDHISNGCEEKEMIKRYGREVFAEYKKLYTLGFL